MRGKMEHQRIVNTVLSNQFKALESERDRVKVDAAHMEMELHGEIDKLKAELEEIREQDRLCHVNIDIWKKDRDLWKSKCEQVSDDLEALRGLHFECNKKWRSKAEKLAVALKAQMQMRDTAKPTKLNEAISWRDNDDLADWLAKAALAEYEKEG